jgi:prepilin-type N-terminal cleavage/methylation domain-containing protein
MLNKKAFTLLEVLLAVSITSIILVCVYTTFWSGMRINARSERDSKIYREVRWSFDLMKKDIGNMVFYDFSNSYPDKMPFLGKNDEMTFIEPSEDGLKVIRYYLSTQAQGKVHKVTIGQTYKNNVDMVIRSDEASYRKMFLIREEIPFVDFLSNSTEGLKQEIISDQIRENSLSIQYGDIKDKNASEVTWTQEWHAPNLPKEIKVTMDFIVGEKKARTLSLTKEIFVPIE